MVDEKPRRRIQLEPLASVATIEAPSQQPGASQGPEAPSVPFELRLYDSERLEFLKTGLSDSCIVGRIRLDNPALDGVDSNGEACIRPHPSYRYVNWYPIHTHEPFRRVVVDVAIKHEDIDAAIRKWYESTKSKPPSKKAPTERSGTMRVRYSDRENVLAFIIGVLVGLLVGLIIGLIARAG